MKTGITKNVYRLPCEVYTCRSTAEYQIHADMPNPPGEPYLICEKHLKDLLLASPPEIMEQIAKELLEQIPREALKEAIQKIWGINMDLVESNLEHVHHLLKEDELKSCDTCEFKDINKLLEPCGQCQKDYEKSNVRTGYKAKEDSNGSNQRGNKKSRR